MTKRRNSRNPRALTIQKIHTSWNSDVRHLQTRYKSTYSWKRRFRRKCRNRPYLTSRNGASHTGTYCCPETYSYDGSRRRAFWRKKWRNCESRHPRWTCSSLWKRCHQSRRQIRFGYARRYGWSKCSWIMSRGVGWIDKGIRKHSTPNAYKTLTPTSPPIP